MAVTQRLVVTGGPELVRTLDRASQEVADMRDGFGAAGQIVAQAASAEAPVLTGALAASVRAERTGERNTATITSPLVYAVPIHWGRPAHNIAPNPFVVRAIESTDDKWTRALEADAQAICNRVRGA